MELRERVLLIYFAGLLVVALVLFGPAGTFDYWQAWAYIGTVFVPMLFVLAYFLLKDQEFLKRRMRTKEKEAEQGWIIKITTLIFMVAFLLPGLDRRFGWSGVPAEFSLAADVVILLGYALVFLVFRENSYASRTVEVLEGQKVVASGPYSIIRHPMYLGTLLMYLATPIALGSYVAFPPFLLLVPAIVLRIISEEKVLRRDLAGYAEYCEKTKYRLIPYIW